MTPRQKPRILIALLSCFLIGDIVGIGCADPCGGCPEGTTCLVPSSYGTLGPTGKLETVTPDPECGTTNWWGAGEAAHPGDGGLVIEGVDAGSCPLVPTAGAGACATCVLAMCCFEAAACSGACSPSDPAGVPLASCISSSCAAQCPGVP